MERQENARRLLPAEDAERLMDGIVSLIRSALEQLPGLIAARIPDSSTHAQRLQAGLTLRDDMLSRLSDAPVVREAE
jgi:hypothetical protein